ncbi:cysteine-rich motor neuron 1 protein-like [Apostichopus japonicus]|uniref:cysteine-rich motor neuron 1 protein-like n=1 Tax=Stichopus japonicus TaxID=307972 RepID=UPI003AB298DA
MKYFHLNVVVAISIVIGQAASIPLDGCSPYDIGWHRDHPCEVCRCIAGRRRCSVRRCAAPNCDDYIVKPGTCCPVCPDDCSPFDSWLHRDPCEECRCIAGRRRCSVRRCAAPSCDNYIVKPGTCCPVCPEANDCDGHPNGSSYYKGPCEGCRCVDGKEICALVHCPNIHCDYPVYRKGQCCPTCYDRELLQ